jgi:hypothetical protein
MTVRCTSMLAKVSLILASLIAPFPALAELSVDEVIRLKEAGVSEELILEMIRTSHQPAASELNEATPTSMPGESKKPLALEETPVPISRTSSADTPAGSTGLGITFDGEGYVCEVKASHGSTRSTVRRDPGELIALLDGEQVARWQFDERSDVVARRAAVVEAAGTYELSFEASCSGSNLNRLTTTVDLKKGATSEIILKGKRSFLGQKFEVTR